MMEGHNMMIPSSVILLQVEWHQSDVKWASRWDVYLEMADTQIHWFSIINSVVVVFFLSGIITMIIIRTLRKDIAKYNMADEDAEDSIEETGWKLVHGDVFRPPLNNKFFAAVIGSGIQIFAMLAITIFFAMLGMLSPASRGALLTAAIFFYEFLGLVAGYYSGRLYRTMKGKEWKVRVSIHKQINNFPRWNKLALLHHCRLQHF